MRDTVLKGTGDSRYLKSVEDFKIRYPTYDDFVAALVAGSLPIDLNGVNAAGMDQVGTPLNKANLLSDETAELYFQDGKPGKRVGDLAAGASVYIPYTGYRQEWGEYRTAWTEFVVVQQGNPDSSVYDSSCDGTWLMMKEARTSSAPWGNNGNDYENSGAATSRMKEFLNGLDSDVLEIVKTVRIPYRPGKSTSATVETGANGLETQAFLLSYVEAGFTGSHTDGEYSVADGVTLDYFKNLPDGASNDRLAYSYFDGAQIGWWTRSPCLKTVNRVWYVGTDGDAAHAGSTMQIYGFRYAFVIPSDTIVTRDGKIVTEAPEASPDTAFSEISYQLGERPAIETGAYVGTGVYGSSNRNSLTFHFVPKTVVVAGNGDVMIWNQGSAKALTMLDGTGSISNRSMLASQSEKTLSYYSDSMARYQMNASGQTYNYYALG